MCTTHVTHVIIIVCMPMGTCIANPYLVVEPKTRHWRLVLIILLLANPYAVVEPKTQQL